MLKSAQYASVIAVLLIGGEAAAKERSLVCAEMAIDRLISVACYHRGRFRWEARDDKRKTLGAWIIDTRRKRSMSIDPSTKTYVRDVFHRMLRNARKSGGYKQALEAHRSRTRMMSGFVITPGRSKWNKHSANNCSWHRLRPAKKTAAEVEIDLCVSPAAKETRAEYLALVGHYRKLYRTHAPLELRGFPLLDPRLPIYRPDGVLLPGHVPKMAVIKSKLGTRQKLDEVRFTIYRKAIDVTAYFRAPRGYRERKP